MNDDDDDNSVMQWQKITKPPTKRSSQVSPEVIRKQIALDTEVSTSKKVNRFQILSDDDEHVYAQPDNTNTCKGTNADQQESEAVMTSESPRPPPIFVADVCDIRGLLTYLKTKSNENAFTYKSQRDGNVRIMVKTVEQYRELIKVLKNDNIKFHTFQLKQDRAFRAVIKNLHFTTPLETIKAEVEMRGHAVRGINNVRSRITKEPLSMFFLDLEPDNSNVEIYNLKYIENAVVTIEPPRKVDDIVQCFRCQEFGHTKSFCNKKFRCVKCSLQHPSNKCAKDKNLPAKCANCLQSHAASYKGCSIYQKLMSNKKSTYNLNMAQNKQTNFSSSNFPYAIKS